MTRLTRRGILVGGVLAVFCGGCSLRSQVATSPVEVRGSLGGGNEVISGVVVNSASGQPLEAADLTLTDTKTAALIAEVNSDAEGRFSFAHVRDGKYALKAVHRGFLPAAFDAHDGYSSSIVTGPGLVSTGLKFELKPLAVIYGAIMDDSGDPVEQARVMLYRPDERGGTGKIVRAGAVISDDLGNYEFPRLAPGNYYIAVIAQPWYATHPQPQPDELSDPSRQKQRSPLDAAYPITYYADVTESDAATPIPVKAGDRIPVNFALHAVPAVSAVLQVPNTQGGGPPSMMPELWQNVFGTKQADGTRSLSYSSHDDGSGAPGITTIELSGLAPGHYEMELHSPRGESGRFMNFDASSDHQAVDTNAGESLAEVSGKVTMAGGDKMPRGLTLVLESQQGEESHDTRVEDDASFNLRGVRPGIYAVVARANEGNVALMQMTALGATVDNRLLKVGSGEVTLTATLVESTAVVTGFAKAGDKGVSGVMVVLVPKKPEANRDLFRRDQSDSDGSFSLRGVIPGEYTVVAIADGWTLDWARSEVIGHYLPLGVKVVVPARSKEIPLPAAAEVQAK